MVNSYRNLKTQFKRNYSMVKPIIVKLCIVLGALLLTSCSSHSSQQASNNTITVNLQNQQTPLYFTGSVKPIHIVTIVSPVDGTVATTMFQYGSKVTTGQLLLTLASNSLTKDYQSALTNFLTAKQKHADSQATMTGTQYLYNVGLIPKNDYLNGLSNLSDANLNYIQARVQLEKILALIHVPPKEIELLSIGDAKAIENALDKSIGDIPVAADANGIALLPPKQGSNDSGGDNGGLIHVGSEVKTGQALVSIGDMSGIAIDITVDEININQVKPGLPAIVTSPAFPGITLHGYVKEVSAQAKEEQSSGLPGFAVKIVVSSITPAEQNKIHVGMSTQVTVLIAHPQVISLPLSAVSLVNGEATVKIRDKKTGQIKIVPVKTGATTLDQVVILSGLASGDEVVVSH
jgi:multidrug efflux pump subunit AcrA (membrane-fusion protein)